MSERLVLPAHTTCSTHVGYRLTCAEFDSLRAINSGRCHWCGKEAWRLEIDHDHSLGSWAVRGLLCRGCNRRIQLVECGTYELTDSANRYLTGAWHLHQQSTAAKRQRAAPRMTCPTCGYDSAMRKDGAPSVHWSRLPERPAIICPASL